MSWLPPAAVLASLLSLLASPAASGQDCLRYEPTPVSLDGILVAQVFPGPPNYTDTLQGDAVERPWILKLDRPICVQGDTASDLNNQTETNVIEVQVLNLPGTDSSGIFARRLLGHRVRIYGTLSHAQTGHHHTKF